MLTSQAIQELLEIRRSAVEDLHGMRPDQAETEWARDRIRDIEYVNRKLAAEGLIPGVK